MNTESWWQRLLNKRPHPTARRKSASDSTRRMEVEHLEDRLVPATNNIFVVGAAGIAPSQAAHHAVFTDPTRFNDGSAASGITEIGSTNNYVAGSLRAAVRGAAGLPGLNTIFLETTTALKGPYSLNDDHGDGGEIDFGIVGANTLTIKNMANGMSAIDAHNGSRIFEIENREGTGQVTLDHLKLTNGNAAPVRGVAEGGAVLNHGNLCLTNDLISGNNANGYGGVNATGYGGSIPQQAFGGGVFNAANATLNIKSTTFDNNGAFGGTSPTGSPGAGAEGGGLAIGSGSLAVSITASTFSHNQAVGGANFAGGEGGRGGSAYGGAVDVGSLNAAVTIVNSTFANNTAQGGGTNAYGGGNAYGGALSVNAFSPTVLNLVNDTIALNTAKGGVATLGSNGQSLGGGVANRGFSTTITSVNTIIAKNTIPFAGPGADVSGTFVSKGHNLIGNLDGSTGFGVNGDIIGHTGHLVDPGLDPLGLQNNGGPTMTIAIIPTSKAIDAGDNTFGGFTPAPPNDQRGPGFNRISGSRVDIGAFEFQVPVTKKKGRDGLGKFRP